mmetsp:Transcript_38756/g.124235  ORF Transcript_38756/g.124235 Transcript_38756/m.124235 type:complete len:405 (+) Transcript_38756:80-1294(+)
MRRAVVKGLVCSWAGVLALVLLLATHSVRRQATRATRALRPVDKACSRWKREGCCDTCPYCHGCVTSYVSRPTARPSATPWPPTTPWSTTTPHPSPDPNATARPRPATTPYPTTTPWPTISPAPAASPNVITWYPNTTGRPRPATTPYPTTTPWPTISPAPAASLTVLREPFWCDACEAKSVRRAIDRAKGFVRSARYVVAAEAVAMAIALVPRLWPKRWEDPKNTVLLAGSAVASSIVLLRATQPRFVRKLGGDPTRVRCKLYYYRWYGYKDFCDLDKEVKVFDGGRFKKHLRPLAIAGLVISLLLALLCLFHTKLTFLDVDDDAQPDSVPDEGKDTTGVTAVQMVATATTQQNPIRVDTEATQQNPIRVDTEATQQNPIRVDTEATVGQLRDEQWGDDIAAI